MLSVHEGRPLNTVLASGLISLTYIFGVNFVVKEQWLGYLGFSVGAALVTGLLAYKRKHRPPVTILEEKHHDARSPEKEP
jgi:hypothetical protein